MRGAGPGRRLPRRRPRAHRPRAVAVPGAARHAHEPGRLGRGAADGGGGGPRPGAVSVRALGAIGRAVVVAEAVACGLAVVVAVYAGLLLQTLSGVRLWSTPWVPVLFVLSAASCGCALLMAGALFRGGRRGAFGRRCAGRRPRRCGRHRGGGGGGRGASRLCGWEAITRACEASADEPACTARRRCPGGQLSWPAALRRRSPWKSAALFAGTWRSRLGVGWDAKAYPIGVPVSEPQAYPAAALALAAALVLVGALGLRAAVVEAGAQRPLGAAGSGSPRFRTFRKRGGGGLAFRAFRRGKRGRRLPQREERT